MNKSDVIQLEKAINELHALRGHYYMPDEEVERKLKEMERNPKTAKTESELLKENEELKEQVRQLKEELEKDEHAIKSIYDESVYLRATIKELKAENAELHCEIQAMNAMPDSEYAKELEKENEELKSELSVKENLLKIKNGLCGEEIPKETTIDGFKCEIIQTAQGLYISRDRIYEIIEREKESIKKKCAELEDRHQSDCITINQLHTALDVMTEKYQRLREKCGL